MSYSTSHVIEMPPTFEEPDINGYTIYTKSYCIFCDKVKQLLDSLDKPYTVVLCDSYLENFKFSFLDFIKERTGREYKTFPMVFYKSRFIGGFSDTEEYCKKEKAFEDVETGSIF